MKCEEIQKIATSIIENEFKHVQEFKERNYADNDIKQKELIRKAEELFKKINEGMPAEYQDLLDDFYAAVTIEWIEYCRFYFKEGVVAGLTNLKFLADIEGLVNLI